MIRLPRLAFPKLCDVASDCAITAATAVPDSDTGEPADSHVGCRWSPFRCRTGIPFGEKTTLIVQVAPASQGCAAGSAPSCRAGERSRERNRDAGGAGPTGVVQT